MRTAIILSAFVWCGGAAFSGTAGLWTFDGQTGSAVPSLLPNRIAGSGFRLEAFTSSSSATPAAVPDARYTDDVPAAFLFPDGALASNYFAFAKSVRLDTSSDRRTANALRMPLGGLDGDFTVEWFVHSETNIGAWVNGFLAGVTHADPARNPVWQLDAYVNGAGNVRTNGTEISRWLNNQPSGRTFGTSDAWHHCALVCVREGGVCRFYQDYRLVNTSPGVEIGPDAVFQLSGTLGVATRSYFAQSVACVRLSDKALARRDFLVARNDPADRTLLRYRFHGMIGAVAGTAGTPRWFRNEANPLPAYDAYAAANASTAEFSGDLMLPSLEEDGAKRSNATSLSSATNGVAACFRLRAGCTPELPHGSFTAEAFFKAENVAMYVLPLFGQGAGAGLDTGWCAFLNQGRLAVRHYLQGVGSQQAAMTPFAAETGRWYHAAVTYDAPARTFRSYLSDGRTRWASEPWTLPEDRAELWHEGDPEFALSSQSSFNSGMTGGLSGLFDEFRFSRGVLAPEEFLRPCGLPGTVVTCAGRDAGDENRAAELRGTAPTALAPFATGEYAHADPVYLPRTFAYSGTENNTTNRASGVFAQPVYAVGDKRLAVSRPQGGDDPWHYNNVYLWRGRTYLGCLMFWGSNTNGFGYPFAALADAPAAWAHDAATGVTTYTKPYLAKNGERRTFTWTLAPCGTSRVELAWDTGAPEGATTGVDAVSPWWSFAPNTWREGSLAFGGAVYAPASDAVLLANPNGIQTEVSGNLAANAENPGRGYTIEWASAGTLTESLSFSAAYSNKLYALILRASSAARGTLVFDLGPALKADPDAPEPVDGIDFWGTDAMEVPRRPSRNLLPNASFEQGLRYFRYTPGGATYRAVPPGQERYTVTDEGLFGTKALRIQATQGYSSGIRTFPVPTRDGQTYTFSFWAKSLSGNRSVSVSLASAAQSGGKFEWYPQQSAPESQFVITETWARYARTFTADAGGLMIQIGGMEWLMDGLQLEEGDAATEWAGDPVEGVLVTSDPHNDLVTGASLNARYVMTGPAHAALTLGFRVQNAFRETVFEATVPALFDAQGRASVPLALDPFRLGEGVFVLRVEYRLPEQAAWRDFHRFSVMTPLANRHATKNLFGTLVSSVDRIGCGERFAAKLRDWGFGATTWGNTADMATNRHLLAFCKKYGIDNFFRPIQSEDPVTSQYLTWTNVTEEIAARIEQVAYDTVRTNDAFFTVWAFGNEEEGSSPLCAAKNFDEYAKAQLACYRGVKRANPNALVLPTCGTSGYSLLRGYDAIDGYLGAAARQGVFYDAVAVHQYGNIDKGTLGALDMDEETQRLLDTLTKHGYPITTPILNTEMFNIPETYLPQWGANGSYDAYQAGKPGYDWGLRESLQAASAARAQLIGLKYHPRLLAINIWVSTPYLDCDLTPLFLCKTVNTLGHHFGDAAHKGDFRHGDSVRGYVFTRSDGTGAAAVWTTEHEVEYGYKKGGALLAALPADTRVYDIAGNRRTVSRDAAGHVLLSLAPAPLILRAASPDTLLESLAGAVVP